MGFQQTARRSLGRICASVLLLIGLPAAAHDLPRVEAVERASKTYPNISPDGRYILYSSGDGFALDIVRRNVETGEAVQLTDDEFENSAATWSPDGRLIAFQREDLTGNRDIWLMRADGSEERRFTETVATNEQHPRFTPDGSAILYDGNRHDDGVEGGNENYEIYRASLKGGEPVRLTENPHWDLYPVSSPDGSSITWLRALPVTDKERADFEIFVMTLASGEARNLSRHAAYDTTPDWSPDGNWIVFTSDRGSQRPGRTDIYLIRPDGTRLTRVTDNGGTSMAYSRPRFSPDGSSIIASRSVAGVTDLVTLSLEGLTL